MAAPLDKLFIRDFEKKNGSVLKINQCEVGDVGCVVWDAAIVLSYFLETEYFKELCQNAIQKKRVVELGAGTGLVGIQAACLGMDCTITDLPDFVPLIDLNIQSNQQHIQGQAKAEVLTWGEDMERFLPSPDFILMADCIYYEESIRPLVTTLCKLADTNCTVLCCYEERTTDNKPRLQKLFFDLIKEHFEVSKIPLEKQDPCYRCEDIHIMIFRKR